MMPTLAEMQRDLIEKGLNPRQALKLRQVRRERMLRTPEQFAERESVWAAGKSPDQKLEDHFLSTWGQRNKVGVWAKPKPEGLRQSTTLRDMNNLDRVRQATPSAMPRVSVDGAKSRPTTRAVEALSSGGRQGVMQRAAQRKAQAAGSGLGASATSRIGGR